MTEQADRTRDAVLTWLNARTKPGAHLCIDSRNIRPGDVFVALKGEHTDGLSWAPVAVARCRSHGRAGRGKTVGAAGAGSGGA